MSSSTPSQVPSISFTIRPPLPSSATSSRPSRSSPLARPSIGPPSRNKFASSLRTGDSDEDDDEESGAFGVGRGNGNGRDKGKGRYEEIVGFGEGGIESLNSTPKGPLIIPSLPNKDWRQSSHAQSSSSSSSKKKQRQPGYVPDGRPSGSGVGVAVVERSGDEFVQGGLIRVKREEGEGEGGEVVEGVEVKVEVKTEDGVDGSTIKQETCTSSSTSTSIDTLTIEQQALQALLSQPGQDDEEEDRKKKMIIGLQENTDDWMNGNQGEGEGDVEGDAFRRDILGRPEESTLDDYASTPIESFGEALLRGMGWNPSAPSTRASIHVPKKRPAGLGLGASVRETVGVGKDGKGGASGSAKGGAGAGAGRKKEDYKTRGGRGYVPLIKKEREKEPTGSNDNGTQGQEVSKRRRDSRSPSGGDSSRRRVRDDERDGGGRRGHDTESGRERERERERDGRGQDTRRDRRDRDVYSGRRDEGRDRTSQRRDEDRDRYDRRDGERERDRDDRDRNRDGDGNRDRYRDDDRRDRDDKRRRDDRDRR